MKPIPDFATIDFKQEASATDVASWQEKLKKETGSSASDLTWNSLEQIPIKPLYTAEDIKDCEHLEFTVNILNELHLPIKHGLSI